MKQSNKTCSVCFIKPFKSLQFHEMITCKKCGVRCHKGCYMPNYQKGQIFVCDMCNYKQQYQEKSKVCFVCGNSGLLKKVYHEDCFAHPICLLFSQNFAVLSYQKLEFILIKEQTKKKNLTCSICSKPGGLQRCFFLPFDIHSSCKNQIHIYCLFKNLQNPTNQQWNFNTVIQNIDYKKFFTKKIFDYLKIVDSSLFKDLSLIQPKTVIQKHRQFQIACQNHLNNVFQCCIQQKYFNKNQQIDQMQCDQCLRWYHKDCIDKKKLPKRQKDPFVCGLCKQFEDLVDHSGQSKEFYLKRFPKLNICQLIFISRKYQLKGYNLTKNQQKFLFQMPIQPSLLYIQKKLQFHTSFILKKNKFHLLFKLQLNTRMQRKHFKQTFQNNFYQILLLKTKLKSLYQIIEFKLIKENINSKSQNQSSTDVLYDKNKDNVDNFSITLKQWIMIFQKVKLLQTDSYSNSQANFSISKEYKHQIQKLLQKLSSWYEQEKQLIQQVQSSNKKEKNITQQFSNKSSIHKNKNCKTALVKNQEKPTKKSRGRYKTPKKQKQIQKSQSLSKQSSEIQSKQSSEQEQNRSLKQQNDTKNSKKSIKKPRKNATFKISDIAANKKLEAQEKQRRRMIISKIKREFAQKQVIKQQQQIHLSSQCSKNSNDSQEIINSLSRVHKYTNTIIQQKKEEQDEQYEQEQVLSQLGSLSLEKQIQSESGSQRSVKKGQKLRNQNNKQKIQSKNKKIFVNKRIWKENVQESKLEYSNNKSQQQEFSQSHKQPQIQKIQIQQNFAQTILQKQKLIESLSQKISQTIHSSYQKYKKNLFLSASSINENNLYNNFCQQEKKRIFDLVKKKKQWYDKQFGSEKITLFVDVLFLQRIEVMKPEFITNLMKYQALANRVQILIDQYKENVKSNIQKTSTSNFSTFSSSLSQHIPPLLFFSHLKYFQKLQTTIQQHYNSLCKLLLQSISPIKSHQQSTQSEYFYINNVKFPQNRCLLIKNKINDIKQEYQNKSSQESKFDSKNEQLQKVNTLMKKLKQSNNIYSIKQISIQLTNCVNHFKQTKISKAEPNLPYSSNLKYIIRINLQRKVNMLKVKKIPFLLQKSDKMATELQNLLQSSSQDNIIEEEKSNELNDQKFKQKSTTNSKYTPQHKAKKQREVILDHQRQLIEKWVKLFGLIYQLSRQIISIIKQHNKNQAFNLHSKLNNYFDSLSSSINGNPQQNQKYHILSLVQPLQILRQYITTQNLYQPYLKTLLIKKIIIFFYKLKSSCININIFHNQTINIISSLAFLVMQFTFSKENRQIWTQNQYSFGSVKYLYRSFCQKYAEHQKKLVQEAERYFKAHQEDKEINDSEKIIQQKQQRQNAQKKKILQTYIKQKQISQINLKYLNQLCRLFQIDQGYEQFLSQNKILEFQNPIILKSVYENELQQMITLYKNKGIKCRLDKLKLLKMWLKIYFKAIQCIEPLLQTQLQIQQNLVPSSPQKSREKINFYQFQSIYYTLQASKFPQCSLKKKFSQLYQKLTQFQQSAKILLERFNKLLLQKYKTLRTNFDEEKNFQSYYVDFKQFQYSKYLYMDFNQFTTQFNKIKHNHKYILQNFNELYMNHFQDERMEYEDTINKIENILKMSFSSANISNGKVNKNMNSTSNSPIYEENIDYHIKQKKNFIELFWKVLKFPFYYQNLEAFYQLIMWKINEINRIAASNIHNLIKYEEVNILYIRKELIDILSFASQNKKTHKKDHKLGNHKRIYKQQLLARLQKLKTIRSYPKIIELPQITTINQQILSIIDRYDSIETTIIGYMIKFVQKNTFTHEQIIDLNYKLIAYYKQPIQCRQSLFINNVLTVGTNAELYYETVMSNIMENDQINFKVLKMFVDKIQKIDQRFKTIQYEEKLKEYSSRLNQILSDSFRY